MASPRWTARCFGWRRSIELLVLPLALNRPRRPYRGYRSDVLNRFPPPVATPRPDAENSDNVPKDQYGAPLDHVSRVGRVRRGVPWNRVSFSSGFSSRGTATALR